MKFRKKPVIIDAIQWTGNNIIDLIKFMNCVIQDVDEKREYMLYEGAMLVKGVLHIKTLEGEHIANIGDWIIKGIKGEFYPCKPDIFELTYEEVESIDPTAQFMNWFLRHYSTSVEGGMLGYVDSMGKPISLAEILSHYKQVNNGME